MPAPGDGVAVASGSVGAFEFDTDTAVERVGDGRYRAVVTDRWGVVGGAPNGGYLVALAARALAAALERPDPLTITAHFLTPPEPGPAELTVETLRRGGTTSTGALRLVEAGEPRLAVLASFGDLSRDSSVAYDAAPPPDLPPLDACVRADAGPLGDEVTIMQRLDARVHPDTVGWVWGQPGGTPQAGGWLRLADGREPDTAMLPLAVDAWAPTPLELGVLGWVPTIELTVHVRARPAPGWLRCWVRTRLVAGGFVEEDCDVWDARGRLVAMSRQLSRVRGLPG